MQFHWDALIVVNLILCIVIFTFGLVSWERTKVGVELYVGTAFGLFGLSHLATLLGLNAALNTFLIIIRTLAYLLVAYALVRSAYRKA